ncbi:polysaccharide lyase [Stieleria marina]|uniref:Disaggregatase related repeat protein n=1 Tax=Stieleria marina TaxID=1930275 RepID=A0A517NRF6_9BACT|nr:Disaggregatase related repeat protein [Planctomycetes bacterium K23_9]
MKSNLIVWMFFVFNMVCPALGQEVGGHIEEQTSGLANWAAGSPQHNDGANREYYNAGANLPWKNFMGDWRDASDAEQGAAAYAVAEVADSDTRKPVRWDVTTLVREWADGLQPNQGMFLRITDGRGTIIFASRESTDVTLRPKLELTGETATVSLDPVADTYLSKSTYRCQGQTDELRVSAAPDHVLIRFDLKEAARVGELSKATLVLQTTKQFGTASIGIFRCRQGHHEPASVPVLGIAARYENDRQMSDDPDVVFATGFERANWQSEWTRAAPLDRIDTIEAETQFQKFVPLQGKALRCRIAKGEMTGLNTLFKFAEQTGKEPEEIFFRYYLRFADDWNQTVQGGKLPGISGTYGRAGWGGRKSNGKDGWSARGLFRMTVPQGNPLAGRTPVGFYCYHADMDGSYGTNWLWSKGYRGYLTTNRWYAIEQHCRLNTPGEKNGVLRAWVDGHLAFEKTDVRFRLTDELRIEQVWMNLYHGGTTPSPHDQHVFIDNVVIAKKYIGPMASQP